MKILLVRHGESRANVDRTVHQRMPDHAVELSERGCRQANAAGRFLATWFTTQDYAGLPKLHDGFSQPSWIPSGKLPFRLWTSPYARARQTSDHILSGINDQLSADTKTEVKVTPESGRMEHINLAEQQFGLFDGLSDEELKVEYPREFEHYKKCEDFEGRFWARMPLGESRFDVAIRVHQAFGTFHRDAERHRVQTLVVVCHGTVIRAFVMRWLDLPFEWIEKEPNPKNGSIRLIDGQKDCGYIHPGGDE